MLVKRIFDICVAGLGILLLSPLFMLIGIWIKIDSPGPIIFRQERVGQFGKPFFINKFRTMFMRSDNSGSQLTVGADSRITKAGYFLRRNKLDELPQLINVILGEMSLVGPRPEVPRYVARYPSGTKAIVLSVKPGITDFASIYFRHENEILAGAVDPEQLYIEKVLPIKLDYYIQYVRTRTFWLDLVLIVRTLKVLLE